MNMKYMYLRYGSRLTALIAAGMALFCGWMALSGRAAGYIHPRYLPLLGGTALFLGISAVAMFRLPLRHRERQSPLPLIVMGLVLCTGLLINPAAPEAVTGPGETDWKSGTGIADGQPPVTTGAVQESAATESSAVQEETEQQVVQAPSGPVVMDDVSFVRWLDELNRNPTAYAGREIILTGMVFRKPEFAPDVFVPARMMMTCCAADVQPVGLLCSFSGTGDLKAGAWVRVTGKLEMMKWKDGEIMGILAEKAEPAEKPAAAYVYPY